MDEINVCQDLLQKISKKVNDNHSTLGLECIKGIKEHLSKTIELYKVLNSINRK